MFSSLRQYRLHAELEVPNRWSLTIWSLFPNTLPIHLSNGPGPLGLMLQVGLCVPPSTLYQSLHLQAPALEANLDLGESAVDAEELAEFLA